MISGRLDVYALCPGGKVRVMKLLSVDPANYPDAPRYEMLYGCYENLSLKRKIQKIKVRTKYLKKDLRLNYFFLFKN